MPVHRNKVQVVLILFPLLIGACATVSLPISDATQRPSPPPIQISPTPSNTPVPPRTLNVCLDSEPQSLFLYVDTSSAAATVRQALYDGPVDVIEKSVSPAILADIPSLENGGVRYEPLTVKAGELIADADGDLVSLADGVSYRPSACVEPSCIAVYTGQDPVQIDQMVIAYRFRDGVQWSDGSPLTADDSIFSFELAQAFLSTDESGMFARTQSYRLTDPLTVEWRGVPGFSASQYMAFLFTPLPRHAWSGVALDQLADSPEINRTPLGWGPYVIDQWIPGDRILLHSNPNYYRRAEGLPIFDNLVFRFIPDRAKALDALLQGECDILDMPGLEKGVPGVSQLQDEGRISFLAGAGATAAYLVFNLKPAEQNQPVVPAAVQFRQAVAQCMDRAALVSSLGIPGAQLLHSFALPDHPAYKTDSRVYEKNLQAADGLLQSLGWIDGDGNPQTPRISQAVANVPDGTPLHLELLSLNDGAGLKTAEFIKASLAECGIEVVLTAKSAEELYAPGSDGPIFGRNFQMALLHWAVGWEPPCFLFATSEIPGPYPDFPRGWGGVNPGGYSNPDFDLACAFARQLPFGSPEYLQAQHRAQAIFVEDLPAIPLYTAGNFILARPDICTDRLVSGIGGVMQDLEILDYGDHCGS